MLDGTFGYEWPWLHSDPRQHRVGACSRCADDHVHLFCFIDDAPVCQPCYEAECRRIMESIEEGT